MILKLSLMTVVLILGGMVPLMGIPGAFVLLISLPGILILNLITGIDAFEVATETNVMWPLAIYLTILWPLSLVPSYLISYNWLANWLGIRPQWVCLALILLWCNLCTMGCLLTIASDHKSS